MAFKVLVVPLLLFLNRDLCSARSGHISRDGLRRHRFRIQAAPLAQTTENATECESLQLAKIYTHCSLPLYIDLVGETRNLTASKSCSPVHAFYLCLEDGLKNTHCSNTRNPLTPTLKFFTSSVLHSYTKRCNLSSDFDSIGLVTTTNLRTSTINQSLTEKHSSSQGSVTNNSATESDHGKRPSPTRGPGDESSKVSVNPPKELNTTVLGTAVTSEGKKAVTSNLTDSLKKRSANELNLDKGSTKKSSKKDSAPAEYFLNTSTEASLKEASSVEVRLVKPSPGPHSDATNVKANSSTNLVNDPNERMRMQPATCSPCIDVNYTFPKNCDTSNLLRRMFTCGVSMHNFIMMNQDICTCFMGYQQCVLKAKDELGCVNTSAPNDPVVATVKLLEGLLMSWYQNPCAIYGDVDKDRDLSDGCNRTHAAVSSVVCYATYFAMSELKTPAPWTSTSDSCSAVNDVNRCLISAQRNTNCTTLPFTTHSRLFLKVITSDKLQECPLDAGFKNNQPSGPSSNPGCQRSKALQRALKCALSFQDLADVERNFKPPSPVPCGHVSRLHTCLEDSVEGTGCYGDISIHSEIKVYKKILEDAYDVHCLVDDRMNSALSPHAQGKQFLMRSHANKHFKKTRGGHGYRSWRKDLGLYESTGDENSGYYYEDSSDGHKPVFAGPRIISVHPDDAENDVEYEKLNSDTLYQKVQSDQEKVGGWRPLTDRQQGKLAAGGNGSAASNDSSGPQPLLQFMQSNEESHERVPTAGHYPEAQMMMASSRDTDVKRPKRKGEDDYFFGNDVENSELAMFPNGLDMFRHFRGDAMMKMESVVGGNASDYNGNECPLAKVKLALGLCNATLNGLLIRWPNVSDIGLPLDGSSSGVKQFCSDLNTYKGCLTAVLKSYNCDHGDTINKIFEVYRKKIRLPFCTSSAHFCHFSFQITLIGFLATLMAKHL
ncbi:unnamed protein product [Ixodes persulcatus]